jgi:hypothetical protein
MHPFTGVICLILLAKCLFFFTLLSSIILNSEAFRYGTYERMSVRSPEEPTGLGQNFSTWDSAHYLWLATHGYVEDAPSCAFYPLWPSLIFLFDAVTGLGKCASALVLANLLSLAALTLCYIWAFKQFSSGVAKLTLLLILTWPGSLFLHIAYSEALFLLLLIALLISIERNIPLLFVMASFLLPMSRPTAFLIAPMLGYATYKGYLRPILLVAPLAGAICYFVIMYVFAGDPTAGFLAQRHFPNQPSIVRMFYPIEFLSSFFSVEGIHNFWHSPLDRLSFVGFICGVAYLYRFNTLYFALVLPMGLVPAITNSFVSYTRYLSICIPLFLLLAVRMEGAKRRVIYISGLWLVIQCWLAIRQINYIWAN